MPVFWWMRLDLVFLMGMTVSGDVFWGVCEVIMILVSLSANGWGCGHASFLAWGVQPWSLLVIGWSWVSVLRRRSLGDFYCLILHGAESSLVVQCPELGSPTSQAQA